MMKTNSIAVYEKRNTTPGRNFRLGIVGLALLTLAACTAKPSGTQPENTPETAETTIATPAGTPPSAQTGPASVAPGARAYTVKTIPNVRLTARGQHVSNPDGIIRPEDVVRINRMLDALEDSLGIEVAVVAVNSIGDADARSFATDLFNYWGLGKKGKDNGLLIQLVTAPAQRSVVFETGYGLEGILPDAISYRLQQEAMIPDLKAGRYSTAMTNGVAAVTNYLLSHEMGATPGSGPGKVGVQAREGGFLETFGMGFLLLFFFVFVLVAFTFRRRPAQICPRCGKKALVYTGQRVVKNATATAPAEVEDVYQCKNCGYTDHRNRHSSRGRSSMFPFLLGGLGGFLGGPRGGGFGGGFGGGSWGGGASGGGGSISRF